MFCKRYLEMRSPQSQHPKSSAETRSETGILEAIDQPPIGTVFQIFHDFRQADQVFDVYGRFEVKLLGGGIQVEEMEGASQCLSVSNEALGESRLPRASWSADKHGVSHCD